MVDLFKPTTRFLALSTILVCLGCASDKDEAGSAISDVVNLFCGGCAYSTVGNEEDCVWEGGQSFVIEPRCATGTIIRFHVGVGGSPCGGGDWGCSDLRMCLDLSCYEEGDLRALVCPDDMADADCAPGLLGDLVQRVRPDIVLRLAPATKAPAGYLSVVERSVAAYEIVSADVGVVNGKVYFPVGHPGASCPPFGEAWQYTRPADACTPLPPLY